MTFRLMACLTLATTVFASSVVAQDEGRGQRGGRGGQQGGGGPGGQQGGRGFGGGMGMTRSAGGAGSILNILAIAEVRKEVGVTDEAFEPVNKMITEYREKQRGMRDATEEERKKATDEYNAKAQDVMDELLAPAKQKRLKGLYAQQAQARAVLNTVIAKEIGVSDTLRTEIEKALQEQMEKMMASFQQGGGSGAGGGAGMREAFTKAQEDASKLVDSKLSAEQKKALEELKGAKFEFPQGGFGFGGGQGGGNRGGQGGGQGGRPRGDGN
ncbi:MAG: hypothetical protein U0930_08540 [Pirellulales bacterium]